MPARRAAALAIAYHPEWKRQSAFGSPIPIAQLTAAFPDTSRSWPTRRETTEDILDCTGQALIDQLVTGRIGELTLEFDVSADLLAGVLAFVYGVASAPTGTGPYVHEFNQLPPSVFALPLTTMLVGFRGSAAPPIVLQDLVFDSIRIRGAARGRISATVDVKFNGAMPDATGATLPDCTTRTPLRMVDVGLTYNNTDLTPLLREFEFAFSNNVLTNDHPFTASSIDVTRLERADLRAESLTIALLGEKGDPLYVDAFARARRPVQLRIGPVSGKHVVIDIPEAIIVPDGGGIRFDGEARESNIRVIARPVSVPSNTDSPSHILATTNQPNPYLVSA